MKQTVVVVHEPCNKTLGVYGISENGAEESMEALRTMPWGCGHCNPGPYPGTGYTVPTESIRVKNADL